MSSQKQIDANRRNAQKCTGPKTPAGKARSSQNALKTGLDAHSEILLCEIPAEFDDLRDSYYRRFAPLTDEERCLVDHLITAEWMSRRYRAVDASVWNVALRKMKARFLGDAAKSLTAVLNMADRRINSAQRNYLKALSALQAPRAARGVAPLPDPLPLAVQSEAPGPVAVSEQARSSEIDAANEPLNEKMVSFPHFSDPAIPASTEALPGNLKANPPADDPPLAA